MTRGLVLGLFGACAAAACSSAPAGLPTAQDGGDNAPALNGGQISGSVQHTVLDERVVSYSDALRTAAVKLTDQLPTLQAVRDLQGSHDQAGDYQKAVDQMVDSDAFKHRMVRWARDTFLQGGGDLDSAPLLLARIIVEGRPWSQLFTLASGNCPTFDGKANTFADGDCNNGAPVQAGVLTNPGTMKQFYSNMAFRRVRWVQEKFRCSKFPAEYADNPVQKGAGQYTSPWDFESVAKSPINFQDDSSVICANCHTSINHLAPLFAHFDKDGMWKDTIAVMTPTTPDPKQTQLSDWLRDGEQTAWRHGEPVKDLAELGQKMAADPAVRQCLVARLWNFAMSKEDIVSDLATVPMSVIGEYDDQLANNSGNLKAVLKSMLKSDDFVKF